jgi:tetratricopeptide (TPR) repeat protein
VEDARVPEKAQFGPDHLEVAADRIALAAILDARGRHHEADLTLRDVVSVLESVLGRDHYEVGVVLDKRAAVLQRSGDHAQAVTLYERSLAIKRRILGADHPDVAETLCDLGTALFAAGRLDDATLALRGALPVLERLTHPRLATCLTDLEYLRMRGDERGGP